MNLIQFIIHRKTLVSMIFIGLCLLGIVSYNQLATELLPSPELPALFVQVSAVREVDPEYLEQKAIIPLEGVIGTLENIDRIESTADRRRGMIRIDYNEKANLKYAYLKLTERINAMRQTLPEEFTAMVIKFDFEQLSNLLMVIQARGSGGINRVRQVVDEKVLSELENIDGIANVDINGGQEKTVTITLNEAACEAQELTPASIRQKIAQYQRDKKFLGYAYSQGQRVFVNSVSEYTRVAELENLVLKSDSQLRLRDVAAVYVGEKEQTTISRVNGKEAVTITLIRDAQANMIDLAQTTRKALDNLNGILVNDDVELVIQTDAAEVMEENLSRIKRLAVIGGLWAVLVLWFFLNNFQLVILIALAIPISILAAMNLFFGFDISINSLTLVGMALAVGMLLDNSIVVLENIYRLFSKQRTADTAIIQGTREVWRSILAATLTTITVFLPFVFASNFLIRLIGKHISVSIISTLFFSLIVALLLIPMAVHWLLGKKHAAFKISDFNVVSQTNRFVQIYTLLLKSAMRFPARTILGTMVIFFLSLIICFAISLNTQEEVELDEINLYVTMPQGATLEQTDLIVKEVEKKLDDLPEKMDIISKIYEEEATLTVKLKEDYRDIENRQVFEIKQEIDERVSPIRTADIGFEAPQSSSRFRSGGGERRGQSGLQRMLGIGSQNERIVIKGHNFAMMQILAKDIQGMLEDLDEIRRATLNIRQNRPEIHLLFDNLAFSYFNVSPGAVVSELATFESETSTGVKFKIGTEEYDIVLKNQELEEKNITDLKRVSVPTNDGGVIDLDKISKLLYSSGNAGIVRINQEKQVEISYRFQTEINDSKELLEDGRLKVDQIVQSLEIPSGIAIEVIHDENELSEFYFLIGMAFLLIYMILASVFESLSTPVVMMFTIPLAAIGSLWGLIITGNSLLNANTLIGFLILLGIVVNNGIILIDYTRILRQRGHSVARALITAGQARLRPILITAITTIVAMIPLAMGQEEYVASVGAPFAITVIGGLAFSVLFTLIFIPTVYIALETTLSWLRGLKWQIQLIQAVLLIAGSFLIYHHIDSFIWKLIDFSLLITVIPAFTYFIQTSLRQARAEMIPESESILIKLRHLVKIFDADMRFVREWKAGRELHQREQSSQPLTLKSLLQSLAWQLLLGGFLIYFTYFYLTHEFWLVFLSVVIYFYAIWVLKSVSKSLNGLIAGQRWWRLLETGFYWLFPLFNGVLFYVRWGTLTGPIFILVLWYLGLLIHHTSVRVLQHKIKTDALSGRFVGLRRGWYLLVKTIPVIGRKKQPFAALKGVSLEIGSGMFGLLGPNGAGKTTLMRMICGILESSRGTITINGIKLSEKREELQGLIGYLPQEFGTYENMPAAEFLEYQAQLKGIWEPSEREKIVQHVLAAVHLEARQHEKIGSFSGGMRQRVGIAQTLLHLPRILVVDEPTAGLDPRERIRFRNLLVELSRDRIVVFSTHIIEDISSSCNALAVLNRGEIKYLGTPEDMVKQARGVVWQVALNETEFEKVRHQLWVVHHIRENGHIKVRFLSKKPAFTDAKTVVPTLEDAYLWMLGRESVSAG